MINKFVILVSLPRIFPQLSWPSPTVTSQSGDGFPTLRATIGAKSSIIQLVIFAQWRGKRCGIET